MDIRSIPIDELDPAPYNPRVELKPGTPEFEKLRRSLDEFGLVEPLVWNERTGRLVGGHQRLSALRALGHTETQVSVVDLPEEREKALNLALNRITGAWDHERLGELLAELSALPEFDLGLTGFDTDEIAALTADFMEPKAESFDLEAELAREGPTVTQPGDLVELGNHRLLCGDCTSAEEVRRLIAAGGGERAALFATDPPYLVGYDGMNRPPSRKRSIMTTDGRAVPVRGERGKDWSGSYAVTWDDADAQGGADLYDKFIGVAIAEALRTDAAWYCWHASRRQGMVERVWEKHGAFVHCQIIWAKNRSVLTRTWYSWKHEPCFFGWRKPPHGKKPPKARSATPMATVWEADILSNGPERPDHPTPKPLELFEIPMRQHTAPGDTCYEPFAGSGTQVIAAERLGRRCLAIEISPRYCDVIVRRWLAYVGVERAPRELSQRYSAASFEAAEVTP